MANKITIKKLKNINVLLFTVVLMIISIAYLRGSIGNVLARKEVSYEWNNYQDINKIIQKDNIRTIVVPKVSDIKRYDIYYEADDYEVQGKVKIDISRDQEVLYSDVLEFMEIANENYIKIALPDGLLKKGQAYTLDLEFDLNKNIIIKMDQEENLKDKQIFDARYQQGIITLILIITAVAFVSIGIINFKENITSHKLYLGIILILGLIVVFILPPFSTPDEARHFRRAYDIAQGNIVNKEYSEEMNKPIMYMPKEFKGITDIGNYKETGDWIEHNSPVLIESAFDALRVKPSDEMLPLSIHGTSGISPIAYLPQVIFIKIAQVFQLSPLLTLYLARLGNLLLWLTVVYFAIRDIPRFKEILLMVALSPGLILLAATCSTDSFLMAMLISFISYMVRMRYYNRQLVTKRNILILSIYAIVIANIKIPYVLVMAFILIMDSEPIKKRTLTMFSVMGIGVVSYGIWSILNQIYGVSIAGNGVGAYVKFVIQTPLKFMYLIFDHFYTSLSTEILQMFSGSAWNLDRDNLLAQTYLIMFIIVCVKSSNYKIFTSRYEKGILTGVILIICTSICFVSFTWEGIDLGYLYGIQGRYFFPLMPFCGMLITNNNDVNEVKSIDRYIGIFLLWMMLELCVHLISIYCM